MCLIYDDALVEALEPRDDEQPVDKPRLRELLERSTVWAD